MDDIPKWVIWHDLLYYFGGVCNAKALKIEDGNLLSMHQCLLLDHETQSGLMKRLSMQRHVFASL